MPKSIYKILIVEDEKIMQDILLDRLSAEKNFQLLIANNGQEGLEAAVKNAPDIILLDIKMPVMDGITMMKALKKQDQLKTIPIIFLTNLDVDEDILKAISDEKPAYYLIKAKTNLEDIAQKIRETLSISK